MNKQVYIVGSGGHARSVIALLMDCGYKVLGVFDDSYTKFPNERILGISLIGTLNDIPSSASLVLAMGDNRKRKSALDRFETQVVAESIVHPSAIVHETTTLGFANLIFPRATIWAEAKLGNNNIVNTGALIEHECTIGSDCHISISSTIAGRVSIGDTCFVGANAVIKDGTTIAAEVTIGAGGVVVRDIDAAGTFVGNPVRKV